MILPLVMIFALAPQPAPIDIGRDSTKQFAFDWSGNYEDGTPGAEVAEVEFQYSPPEGGGQQRWVKIPFVATTGENRVPVREALAGIPAGIYNLRVRLLDPGGQPSTYSTPLLSIRVRVKNPSAPANVRVVLLYSDDSPAGWGKKLRSIS